MRLRRPADGGRAPAEASCARAHDDAEAVGLNVPNTITLLRIVACPLVAALILHDAPWARTGAFGLFLLAALSDSSDGRVARRHGCVTEFGALADPIADKLLVAFTFVPLASLGELPAWFVSVVLGREVLVTLLRSYSRARGRVISASKLGKQKTFAQNLLIGFVLFRRVLPSPLDGDMAVALHRVSEVGAQGLLWIALGLTLVSLGQYLHRNRSLLPRRVASGSRVGA